MLTYVLSISYGTCTCSGLMIPVLVSNSSSLVLGQNSLLSQFLSLFRCYLTSTHCVVPENIHIPPMAGFFGLNLPFPLEIPVLVHMFCYKFGHL